MRIKTIRGVLLPAVALLFTAAIATSCLKDDLSECPPEQNVILRFRLPDAQQRDVFQSRITNTRVAIYTATGNFVREAFLEQSELTSFQGTKLLLPAGDYRVVCWGNTYENSSLNCGSKLSDACLDHARRAERTAANGDPLYYAPRIADLANPEASAFTLTVPSQGSVDKTIDFTAAHKQIKVYVKGLSDVVSGVTTYLPTVEVANLASAYDFRLQTLTELPIVFTQRAVATTDPKIGMANFFTAYFSEQNDIMIDIKLPSNGDCACTVDLQKFIRDNSITLTGGDYDLIEILVEFKGTDVSITAPGWGDSPIKPIF